METIKDMKYFIKKYGTTGIDLSSATKEGLDMLMECSLEEENYERCALIRTEILRRMEVPIYLPITQ